MLRLYFRLIGARIQSQMQYKASFWFSFLSFTVMIALNFVTIAVLVSRFGTIAGWNLAEVAMLYGLISIGMGFAQMVGRGFDGPFERMMQQGAFDGVLIRPMGALFQIFCSEFQLMRLGRVAQGLATLLYSFWLIEITWSLDKIIVLLLAIITGFVAYLAMMIISATLCFWTIRMPEVVNVFTFGGTQAISYPLGIYDRFIRNLFLFVLPIGFGNYPATLYILGKTDPIGLPVWSAWFAPVFGVLLMLWAILFWRFGVSKYTSTGS
jgi:ABC-2 type transport system permease protein